MQFELQTYRFLLLQRFGSPYSKPESIYIYMYIYILVRIGLEAERLERDVLPKLGGEHADHVG